MSQLHATISTFFKELRTTYSSSSYLFKLFGDATRSAVIAWIVYLSGDKELLAYICVGAFLLAIWTGVIAMSGWSLSNELSGRTLDFILTSHTPMPVILFSKTLAQMAYEAISGIVALITVLLVAREIPEVANVTCVSDGPLQKLTFHLPPGIEIRPEIKRILGEGNIESMVMRDPTLEEAYLNILR